MQENNIWLVNYKTLKKIPLFQSIATSKADNLIQYINTANQITPIFIYSVFKRQKLWISMQYIFY